MTIADLAPPPELDATLRLGPGLPHYVFFSAVAEAEEAGAARREATGGLLVLRLVDAWSCLDADVAVPDIGGLWVAAAGARHAVAAIADTSPVKALLGAVVDGIATTDAGDPRAIADGLLAYGRALRLEARWELAADVFHTVAGLPLPDDASSLVASAYLGMGFCFRTLGRLDAATKAYQSGRRVAIFAGDRANAIRGLVGEAKVVQQRGNLPAAEEAIECALREARRLGDEGLLSQVLHDRGRIAYLRGRLVEAVGYWHEALDRCSIAAEREALLEDLAVSLADLGQYAAARKAHLVLYLTSQSPLVRWGAAAVLMLLAAQEGVADAFERYREELASVPLPPELATECALNAVRGHRLLGDMAAADAELDRAADLAARHGLHALSFRIEAERAATTDLASPTPVHAPADVERRGAVARAMRTMRELYVQATSQRSGA